MTAGAETAGAVTTGALAVRLHQVLKTFDGVVANRDASLDVAAGEIHALVGENGAGKSTLMRVLAGLYAPDGGEVEVHGRRVTGWSTPEAIAAGVGLVHQHFMLVPTLTVAENVVLGQEPRTGLRLDRARAEAEVTALCERSGLHVDPRRLVSELSVGEAQRVEILKALYRGTRVLILDEPTAVLSPPEVAELWQVLRTLRAAGGTVILITHKLDEVLAISDMITVMRAGRTVARFPAAGTTPREIARAMVGRDVQLALDAQGTARGDATSTATTAPMAASRTEPAAPVRLQVETLTVRSDRGPVAVEALSFAVRAGEILGIAGVEGNGQTELLEALAGLRPVMAGTIRLGAHDITQHTVRERADRGLSHIPEDRQRRGLIMEFPVAENLILGQQHRYARWGRLDHDGIARHAADQIARFDIRPADPARPVQALSGGNQQKVVIAREMGRSFEVLLAAQPTRGVDVGAIEFIHGQLRAAREAGKGILLVSADLSEVLALADRVAVMYRGRFVTVLPAGDCSAEQLGPYMTGAAA